MKKDFHSGFVTIIGRSNVGKSTLLNTILGQKISIISPKPQTTRNQIKGIYTTDNEQVIFIDTPGIHKPRHQLGEFMNRQAFTALNEVDLILYMVDGTEDFGTGEAFIIERLKRTEVPVILVVNKIDLIKNKKQLAENILKYDQSFNFLAIYYISALNGENVPKLLLEIIQQMPLGPKYYPGEEYSDQPESFIVAEIIREKALLLTREEIPHSLAVVIDHIGPADDNPDLLEIRATIFVERASQKKIMIGAGGLMLKEIGTRARREIVMLFGQKIYLDLWVKVEDDWRNKKTELRRLGYFLE